MALLGWEEWLYQGVKSGSIRMGGVAISGCEEWLYLSIRSYMNNK